MRTVEESAAHYRAMIAELRQRLEFSKREAAELPLVIARLERLAGDEPSPETAHVVTESLQAEQPSPVVAPSATSPSLAGLSLGEACVVALGILRQPATNKAILQTLVSKGYKVQSANPLNNVGTCLNHRSKSRGDIEQGGKNKLSAIGRSSDLSLEQPSQIR